jgi:hypothetical protein
MLDLGFVILLAVWSAGVGLWVVKRLRLVPEHPWDALALAIPIGLGLLALATLGLGEVGALSRLGIGAVLGVGGVVGLASAPRLLLGFAWEGEAPAEPGVPAKRLGRSLALPFSVSRLRGWLRASVRPRATDRPRREWVDRALALGVLVALVGTLLTALAPVTDGDALCYHLQVPKMFLERGAAGFDPDLHETVYPLATQMLYAVALAFRGPVACRLVQWMLGLVFALNVTSLARPSLGARAWWAGAIAVLVPAITNGMSAPLNDVALAAFGAAALVAGTRFHATPSLGAAALTGLITGLAMGVKYPALVLAGLIGLAIGAGLVMRIPKREEEARPEPDWRTRLGWSLALPGALACLIRVVGTEPRRRLAHLVVFALVAMSAGGAWYVRAWAHTGNPVHPFFRQTFAGAGLDEVLGAEKRPMAVDLWHLVAALGPLTLEPDRFDSFSHQFGPVFLLFLPALLWEQPPRRVLALAAIGYLFLMLCMTQRQSMRFLLIALAPLSVAVAWLAQRWWERRSGPSRLLVAVLLALLGFESVLALARARHGLGVVLGVESPDHYLTRREPTYPVGKWVAAQLPAAAHVVGQDHRGFYIPRHYTMELAHRRRVGLGRCGESSDRIIEQLRGAGFSHLLLCPPVPESAVEFDPTLGRLLAPWLERHHPLYREVLTDADGVARRYAIYALEPDRHASAPGAAGGVRR